MENREILEIRTRLDEVLKLLHKMNIGLYGDFENKHIGVIEKQEILSAELKKIKEEDIERINEEIEKIKLKNYEQDISIKAKQDFKYEMGNILKLIISIIIQTVAVLAVIKGIIGIDSLIKI